MKKWITLLLCVCLTLFMSSTALAASSSTYIQDYYDNTPHYQSHEQPLVDAFRAQNNGSEAHALVERAIWYMENGYMIYGHSKYPTSGLIDCSNFVSLVYKDFGYNITSAARKYGTVGQKVSGVYTQKINGKYVLKGTENLRPGDIFTFWKVKNGERYIGHVAIYMGKINGEPCIIHTAKGHPTAIGITNNFSWWYGEHFNSVRRVLSDQSILPSHPYQAAAPVIPSIYKLSPQKPVILPGQSDPGNTMIPIKPADPDLEPPVVEQPAEPEPSLPSDKEPSQDQDDQLVKSQPTPNAWVSQIIKTDRGIRIILTRNPANRL
ncbi:MAG TPA: hypothetical protein GX404_04450 [Syntrophomonadaceae bacterium]|nr:hypothetical protein [Syntrophomonadaceae bacterium]